MLFEEETSMRFHCCFPPESMAIQFRSSMHRIKANPLYNFPRVQCLLDRERKWSDLNSIGKVTCTLFNEIT